MICDNCKLENVKTFVVVDNDNKHSNSTGLKNVKMNLCRYCISKMHYYIAPKKRDNIKTKNKYEIMNEYT